MFKMEISAEKAKLTTNSATHVQREIKVKGQRLGTVTSFKYLGAVVSDDGSKLEVQLLQNCMQFGEVIVRLGCKVKLLHFLVVSTFLYACEMVDLSP